MQPTDNVDKWKDTPSSRPTICYSCAQYGNEIVLTYKHHKEPTALDLRHMGEMLMREAQNCFGAAEIIAMSEERTSAQ